MRLIFVLVTGIWMMFFPILVSAHGGAMPENLSDSAMDKLGHQIYVVHGLQQLPSSRNQGFISNARTRSVLPDHKRIGGEKLNIGGKDFKIHHTGHAYTDSDVMIELTASRVLFTGDIVE